MRHTPGSSIRGVGGPDSDRHIPWWTEEWAINIRLDETKLAVRFIDCLVDVWVPGEVV